MNCNIGKQILKFRKNKGISQTELANFLGVQSQTVSKWEREVCMPDIDKLPQIAAFFGITLDNLFGISEKSALESALLEIDSLISQKKWSVAAKKAAAFALEFPMQKNFVQKMLAALSQALLCKEHFSKKFTEEAVALGKRALQEINEPNIKNDIEHSLCAVLYQIGRTAEADFYRESIPSAAICRETLDMFKYSGSELCNVSKKNISIYHALIASSFWEIAGCMDESKVSAEYMEKSIYHFKEAYRFSGDKRYLRTVFLSQTAISKTYFNIGEKASAATALEEAEKFAREHGLGEIH